MLKHGVYSGAPRNNAKGSTLLLEYPSVLPNSSPGDTNREWSSLATIGTMTKTTPGEVMALGYRLFAWTSLGSCSWTKCGYKHHSYNSTQRALKEPWKASLLTLTTFAKNTNYTQCQLIV